MRPSERIAELTLAINDEDVRERRAHRFSVFDLQEAKLLAVIAFLDEQHAERESREEHEHYARLERE